MLQEYEINLDKLFENLKRLSEIRVPELGIDAEIVLMFQNIGQAIAQPIFGSKEEVESMKPSVEDGVIVIFNGMAEGQAGKMLVVGDMSYKQKQAVGIEYLPSLSELN